MDKILVMIIDGGKSYKVAPSVVDLPGAFIRNPSEAILNKLGYWDLHEVPSPEPEDGYKIFDDGYIYEDIGDGKKIVTHKWRKLLIVDVEDPDVADNEEVVYDEWEETDTEYRHVIKKLTIIDEPPELAEDEEILDSTWVIDEEAGTKTRKYTVIKRIDNPPVLEEGQEVVEDWWQLEEEGRVHHYKVMNVVNKEPDPPEGMTCVNTTFIDDEETNTRTYSHEYRIIVDNPPELAENQFIGNTYWTDDGETRTHVYEVWTKIDNPPVLEEGQEIVDRRDVLNEEEHTITTVYTIRYVVDNGAPELGEDEFIMSDYWNDDGETRTHIYDVWKLRDEPRPADSDDYKVFELGVIDDPSTKTRGMKYLCKPIIRNKPEDDPEGNFKYVFDYEKDTGTEIVVHYKRVDKIWRTFSKLKLEYALFKLGKLADFFKFLDETTMTNDLGESITLRHFYDTANDLSERHEMFRPYINNIISSLGLSDKQADEFLENVKADPVVAQ